MSRSALGVALVEQLARRRVKAGLTHRNVLSACTNAAAGSSITRADPHGGPMPDLSPREKLQPLADLLGQLTSCAVMEVWRYRCDLGTAGHIDVTYRFDPHELDDATRTEMLTVAARLVNWSHT